MGSSQFFQQEDMSVELPGIVLKLNEDSVLLLDIKKMDLTTGKISDYGFAL